MFWQAVSTRKVSKESGDLQDRVPDEEDEDTDCDERQTTDVDKASSGEYVTIARFAARIRVVQVVVLFHIFGEQQQTCRG